MKSYEQEVRDSRILLIVMPVVVGAVVGLPWVFVFLFQGDS